MTRVVLALLLWVAATSVAAQTRGAFTLTPGDGSPAVELYANSYALVIGNDAYSGGWPRLSNAVRDATEVARDLEKRGFEVTLLTDLTSDAMEEAVEDFIYGRGDDEASRLLIWYAGHGHMIGDEAYLVPVDAPAPQAEGRFRRMALSMRDFGKFMREVRSRHVLAIFDSCFSGNVFETARALPSPAITRATSLPVREMISSGDAGQTVSDDGTFRRLFLDALSGDEPNADANHDGYLTGSELGLFLSDKVTSLTFNRQTPRYGRLRELGFDRGDFVFKVGATAAASPRHAAPLRAAPAPRTTPAAVLPQVGQTPTPPADAAPPAPPPAAASAPMTEEQLEMGKGESRYLMGGRLVFSVLGLAGGRSDLIGVIMNGRRKSAAIGSVMTADGESDGCTFTLLQIVPDESRGTFLLRCGAPSDPVARKAAMLAIDLPPSPASVGKLTIEGNQTNLLLDGRLTFSMIGTPAGGRSDLVGVIANGRKTSLGIGGYIAADGASDGCVLTLMQIAQGENRAEFLVRCGGPSGAADRKAATLAVAADGPLSHQEAFTMTGGSSRPLDSGGTVLSVTGTPAGGRSDLFGVVLNGKKKSLSIGERLEVPASPGPCALVVTHIHKGANQADFLLTCG